MNFFIGGAKGPAAGIGAHWYSIQRKIEGVLMIFFIGAPFFVP
jgi:hypothetical protein